MSKAKPEKDLKVAIIGKAPASIQRAPFDDESWQIWSLSDNYNQIPRWDVWFELHNVDYHRRQHSAHWQFLTTDHGKPLYLLSPHKDIPHATIYPKDEILGAFPPGYFTNSISWMMALAALQGAKAIGIYGVDMAQQTEYEIQRPSCEWMIGFCQGMGIEVDIPEESDLMKCRKLYGYDTHGSDMYAKTRARLQELEGRQRAISSEKAQAQHELQMALGALHELRTVAESNGQYDAASRMQVLQSAVDNRQSVVDDADRKLHILQGAVENMHWARQWC